MFSHICKTYYPLFFLVVHMYPVWCGLHDTLIPLDSTYASPGPPKMKTKIEKNVHQITSIFYILLSFGVILRCLWGLEAYSKTCLQGTPQYPRESVPTWQVSLHHRVLNMGKIGHRSEKVSPDHRVSPRCSVPWRQVLLYIYNVYEFCWPMYTDLGRPGDTFAVAGDRAI